MPVLSIELPLFPRLQDALQRARDADLLGSELLESLGRHDSVGRVSELVVVAQDLLTSLKGEDYEPGMNVDIDAAEPVWCALFDYCLEAKRIESTLMECDERLAEAWRAGHRAQAAQVVR